MAFPESFIQELKMRNSITEVVAPYVSLKRNGRNMVGLCPFHGEKTPSFNIYDENTDNAHFYCFGCGVGGDVISFVMRIENLDYVDAVKLLAQRAGMDLPETGYDDSMSRLRKRIFEANREAARFYYKSLYQPVGREGLNYLHGRMLTDRTIRHFGLGFADDDWSSLTKHLKSLGFSEQRGNVIAFGGRIMTDQKPKYLNTSDTPVFKKSENLFSLNNAKNAGTRTLLLCEGYMDVIAVSQAGFSNAVATLGTALTQEQAMLMKRYADEVIICYDADEAGQKATSRAIPILRGAGLPVRVLTIPNGKDPDEFIKSQGADGPEAFRAIIEKSGNDMDYRLQKLRGDYDLETSDGKVQYLEAASAVIATLDSAIEQDVYAAKLCREFGVDKNAFMTQLQKRSKRRSREAYRRQQQKLRKDLSGRVDRINIDKARVPRSSSAEEALVVYLIRNPDAAPFIAAQVKPEQFQNALMRRFYTYFSERVQSGADPMLNVTADFTPDEANILYQIIGKHASIAQTRQSLEEYIKVIREESVKLRQDEVSGMSGEDLNAYLEKLRKVKQ